MGILFSLCSKKNPIALNDERAALRAGARIHVSRNDIDDPRAPLVTKSLDTPKNTEADQFDEELDEFVKGLSSGSDINPNDDDIDNLVNNKSD